MRTIAIKYCGGCNPRFDRAGFVSRLVGRFPELVVVSSDTVEPWLVLVVCGCHSRCASHEHMAGLVGKIVVYDDVEFDKVCEVVAGSTLPPLPYRV